MGSSPQSSLFLAAGTGVAEAVGMDAAADDVSRLRRSDLAKTALLHSVSHDLRGQLAAICAAADGLVMSGAALSFEEQQELLDVVRTTGWRMTRLLDGLLDLSRLRAGEFQPDPRSWPVRSLVERSLETVWGAGSRVDVDADNGLTVFVDPAQFERILANLIDNGLRVSPTGEKVTVRARRAGDGEVWIDVVDRGPGISRDHLESIFKPFTKGSPSTSGGSGLGLSIARAFAEVNQGRIWVDSNGAGSTFTLAVPTGPKDTPSCVDPSTDVAARLR